MTGSPQLYGAADAPVMTTPPTAFPAHPFTRTTARQMGISNRRLRDALNRGETRRLFQGVYCRSDLELTQDVRAAALFLVVSPDSVVCDRTAAWLHGVDAFGYGEKDLVMPIEICALRNHSRTRRTGVDGRVRDLAPHDVMTIDGIRVTTPLRTALDLGCALTRLRALGVLDALRRLHDITLEDLHGELGRYYRRRGVLQLRRLIPMTDPRAESLRESATRARIIDAGLPVPELQWWVEIDGVRFYRLDLAYPHLRIAIEYDGEEFHRRTAAQMQADRERRDWLRRHHWTVIVVDADTLFTQDTAGWVDELRRALRPRTKRLRWAGVAA